MFMFRDNDQRELCYLQRRGWGDYVVWLKTDRLYDVSHVRTQSAACEIVEMLAKLDLAGRQRVIDTVYRGGHKSS